MIFVPHLFSLVFFACFARTILATNTHLIPELGYHRHHYPYIPLPARHPHSPTPNTGISHITILSYSPFYFPPYLHLFTYLLMPTICTLSQYTMLIISSLVSLFGSKAEHISNTIQSSLDTRYAIFNPIPQVCSRVQCFVRKPRSGIALFSASALAQSSL